MDICAIYTNEPNEGGIEAGETVSKRNNNIP